MPTNFSTRTEIRDGIMILFASGEVDLSTSPRLAAAIDGATLPGAPLIADLTAVEFIDSAGSRAMVLADRAVAERGGRLLIVPSPAVDRVFGIASLDEVFHLFAELDEALDAGRELVRGEAA